MTTLNRCLIGLFAAGWLVSAPACLATFSAGIAQDGGYRVEGQRRAYARGYDVGRDRGRADAQKGRRLDFEQHNEFRDGNKGYNRRDGDRNEYRDAFRNGFSRGYTEAYRANERRTDRDRDDQRR